MHKIGGLLIGILTLAGCQTTKPLYYWGNYEKMVYEMYREPGKATPDVQIEQLNRDIERAQANGQRIPPGLFAHLGLMHALNGDAGPAEAAFNEERARYPESKILIDGMLTRAGASAQQERSGL